MAKQRATSKANLDRAVKAMQAHLGSLDKVRIRDAQRLYDRVKKYVDKIADETGMLPEDVWKQLEDEARKRGIRAPTPGRDFNPTAEEDLEAYGYRILPNGRFYSIVKDKEMGVVHSKKRGRHYYHSTAGQLLASGMTPVAFVRKFWYAEKRRNNPTTGTYRPEFRAWTGGSPPPKKLPAKAKKLADELYAEQVADWREGWGDDPDKDTKELFRKRARYDAWATYRDEYEENPVQGRRNNPGPATASALIRSLKF